VKIKTTLTPGDSESVQRNKTDIMVLNFPAMGNVKLRVGER